MSTLKIEHIANIANSGPDISIDTNGHLNIVNGSLQMGGTTMLDTSDTTLKNISKIGISTATPEGLISVPATASNTPKFRLQSASTNTDFAISSYADANGTYVALGANHYLNSSGNDAVFETTDRNYVIADGSIIAEGTSRDLLKNTKAISHYFGSDFSYN